MTATNNDNNPSIEANKKTGLAYDPIDSGRDVSAPLGKQLHTAAALINSGLARQLVGREEHYHGLAQTYGIWLTLLDDEALTAKVAELYEDAKLESSLDPSQFTKGMPKLVDQVVTIQFPELEYKRRKENAKVLLAARHANISELTFISWMKKSGGKTSIHKKPKVAPVYGQSKRLLDLCDQSMMSRKNPSDYQLADGEIYAMIVHRIGPDYEVMSVIVDMNGSRIPAKAPNQTLGVPDKGTLLASVGILSTPDQRSPSPQLDDEPLADAS